MQKLLTEIGLEAERLQMFQMSSAMGGAFAAAATEMAEKIGELGTSPLRVAEES